MNDFTKDELDNLRLSIHETIISDTGCDSTWRMEMRGLKLKIQSLIDNYCEHDEGYEQDSMMVDICKKCNEVF